MSKFTSNSISNCSNTISNFRTETTNSAGPNARNSPTKKEKRIETVTPIQEKVKHQHLINNKQLNSDALSSLSPRQHSTTISSTHNNDNVLTISPIRTTIKSKSSSLTGIVSPIQAKTTNISNSPRLTLSPRHQDQHHNSKKLSPTASSTTNNSQHLSRPNLLPIVSKDPSLSASVGLGYSSHNDQTNHLPFNESETNYKIYGKSAVSINPTSPCIVINSESETNLISSTPTQMMNNNGGSGSVGTSSPKAVSGSTSGISSANDECSQTMTFNIGTNNNNSFNVGAAIYDLNCSLAFYDYSDQELMQNDNKYKQYAGAIDKALKSFEYTSEWADLVNALGKLNKVLTNNSRFGRIPRRFVVGQRLAQCMHPLLPSGVHLKALETYDQIFKILGKEQLLADLTIYSNGLFHLLGYAAINVRPAVLDLYERHLLTLGDRLKLALDGFLISLLPCYEEGQDSFQRTGQLLLNVSQGVGVAYFYGALWRCILQNSSIRLSAITFVLMNFNKKRPLSEQAHVLGLCMRTLVRAICSALLDTHILVQRAILDLLITIFPIHLNTMNQMEEAMSSPNNTSSMSSPSRHHPSSGTNNQQQQVMHRKYFKQAELVAIITAALTVLLRRDLSLNRRLSAWFFGSDSSGSSTSGPSSSHYHHHSTTTFGISGSTASSNHSSSAKSPQFNNSSTSNGTASKSSTTTANVPLTSTSGLENSSEAKARRKKLIYFETYARDLVIEAFKRCITNPLMAITSILPPTALTNSFITFTLPYVPLNNNMAGSSTNDSTSHLGSSGSASSSPSSSTTSLIHAHSYSQYRTNSLHGNHGSRTIHNQTGSLLHDSYSSTTMSTFWPYRLLNCIMDQRDIAGPIIEKLCVDILRGLYHEFELLTNVVPPPTTILVDDFSTTTNTASNTSNTSANDNFKLNSIKIHNDNKKQHSKTVKMTKQNNSSTTTLSSVSLNTKTKNENINVGSDGRKTKKIKNKHKHRSVDATTPTNQSQTLLTKQAKKVSVSGKQTEKGDDVSHETTSKSITINKKKKRTTKRRKTSKSDNSVVATVTAPPNIQPEQNEKFSSNSQTNQNLNVDIKESSESIKENEQKHRPDIEEDEEGYEEEEEEEEEGDDEQDEGSSLLIDFDGTNSLNMVFNDNQNVNLESKFQTESTIQQSTKKSKSMKKMKAGQKNKTFMMMKKTKHPQQMFSTTQQPTTTTSDDDADCLANTSVNNSKRNLNLFRNLRQVRNKFINKFGPVQPTPQANSPVVSATVQKQKKLHVLGNFMSKQLRLNRLQQQQSGALGKSVSVPFRQMGMMTSKFGRNKKKNQQLQQENAKILQQQQQMRLSNDGQGIPSPIGHDETDGRDTNKLSMIEDDDDSVFILPHQHYYWNPYYQQLSKAQRQELLKELDRVMHLLFTNLGVDFVWTKLACIFQSATEEAIELKKFLHIIVKTTTKETKRIMRNRARINKQNKFLNENSSDDQQNEEYLDAMSNECCSPIDDDTVSITDDDDDNDDDFDDGSQVIGDDGDETDTQSQSQSLTWIRQLASTMITELAKNPSAHGYSYCCSSSSSSSQIDPDEVDEDGDNRLYRSSPFTPCSTFSSNSSSPSSYASFSIGYDAAHKHPVEDEDDDDDDVEDFEDLSTMLKHGLLKSLADRCRNCGQTLTYNSPVQPVGTESVTILEACTLVRFILGDSLPFQHYQRPNYDGDDGDNSGLKTGDDSMHYPPSESFNQSRAAGRSLLINSISVSMNRCSALEPLAVDTANYAFLVNFLDHVLRLMSQTSRSFTPVDLRASVELCLALSSKLKPAIMQTFVSRYKNQVNLLKNKDYNQNDNGQTSRKPSLSNTNSMTNSQTVQLTAKLERVKEEDGDGDLIETDHSCVIDEKNDNDQINQTKHIDRDDDEILMLSEDLQLELVVDSVLEFFSTFVESLMVKKDNNQCNGENNGQYGQKSSNRQVIFDFFRLRFPQPSQVDKDNRQTSADHEQLNNGMVVRHELLSIYELLCELLIEVGTMPLLSSPAFLLKRRHQTLNESNRNNESIEQQRWFIYLMSLSSNGLHSCQQKHRFRQDNQTSICCQVRQIAYTSLSTLLDLVTISRAYMINHPVSPPAKAIMMMMADNNSETQSPDHHHELPYMEMSRDDTFPETCIARRLNFFPLVYPSMLNKMSNSAWLKCIASGLWSNLSPDDSCLHYATAALLQQLHSVCNDDYVCEVVICDEMTTNGNSVNLMANDYGYNQMRSFNMDRIHQARCKFARLFAIISDIRFVSERLALMVNALASSVKANDDDDSIRHAHHHNSSSTLANCQLIGEHCPNSSTTNSNDPQGTSGRLLSQLEMDALMNGPPSSQQHDQADVQRRLQLDAIMSINMNDLHRLLKITCPIAPVHLCSTLKRHFDRPLLIMLDALLQRRSNSDQYSMSADWLLRCIKNADQFGTKNLMFTVPNGFGVTSQFAYHQTLSHSASSNHIDRLLEPLLFILLHPNTARLSLNKNVIIHRYTRQNSNKVQTSDNQQTHLLKFIGDCQQKNNIQTVQEDFMIDDSKIYTITSQNGSIIYHINRRPPSRSLSNRQLDQLNDYCQGFFNHFDSFKSSMTTDEIGPNDTTSCNKKFNPNNSKRFPSKNNPIISFNNDKDVEDILQTELHFIVQEVLDDVMLQVMQSIQSNPDEMDAIDIKRESPETGSKLSPNQSERRQQLAFPGMASYSAKSKTKLLYGNSNFDTTTSSGESSCATPTPSIEKKKQTTTKQDNFDNNYRSTLRFCPMHSHLLLYERRYDSNRTIYALDTILAMIETWPSRILYSMATSMIAVGDPFFGQHQNQIVFDGRRSAQIKNLYQRHLNSRLGFGFYNNANINNHNQNANTNKTNNQQKSAFNKKKQSKSSNVDNDETQSDGSNQSPNEQNITLLELIIQICLQYLRSYYPSCPVDMMTGTSATNNDDDHQSTSNKLNDLFESIRMNDNCIDAEAIYGNQRVRLLACQTLRIILYHLSQMIEVPSGMDLSPNASTLSSPSGTASGHWSRSTGAAHHSSHHKRQSSSGISVGIASNSGEQSMLCFSQSKSFVQYLRQLLVNCQVQQNVLQCLVTSIWHYEHKNQKQQDGCDNTEQESKPTKSKWSKYSSSYISYSTSSYLFPSVKPAKVSASDLAFISEILDYNDYPKTSCQMKNLDDHHKEDRFHDELEQALLHLVEQVMILEWRVNAIAGSMNTLTNTGSNYNTESGNSSTSSFIERRTGGQSAKDLTELSFENDVPLAGQPMLNSALYYILQQNHRNHVQQVWLSFLESSLNYAGRYMPRLVITVLQQLCRNLDSSIKQIEEFASSSSFVSSVGNNSMDRMAPFNNGQMLNILQGIAMIYSYCLLDRQQYELLAPIFNEIAYENDDELSRQFGLSSGRRRHLYGRNRYDGEHAIYGPMDYPYWLNNSGQVTGSNNGSNNPIHAITNLVQAILLMSSSTQTGGSTSASNQLGSNAGQSALQNNDPPSGGDYQLMSSLNSSHHQHGYRDTLANNLQMTRQRILDYSTMNRVLTTLFQVWCSMVSREDNSTDDGLMAPMAATMIDDDNQLTGSTCCHPYLRASQYRIPISNRNPKKQDRHFRSNCGLGWSSSVYTGWYISGSPMVIRRSILTILSILAVSNGVPLMKSMARVWHDLRDRTSRSSNDHSPSRQNHDGPLLVHAIDVVIMNTTPQQQKLIQLCASLVPILNLEYFIQIVRAILKPGNSGSSSITSTSTSTSATGGSSQHNQSNQSSSTTNGGPGGSSMAEVESTSHSFTTNPFDNIFLIELSILELFLAYIRTCSGETLLKSWRSMLSLLKDGFSLNLSASVPYETFWPMSRSLQTKSPRSTAATVKQQQQRPIPSSSVQINFQPLINIHLLAILHEFVIATNFVEDRRAQKELQDTAQRLIEANIDVAAGRLLPPRFWTFRRNFEVMPLNNDVISGGSVHHRSPTDDSLLNDQHIVKRGLFRSSASVQFQNDSNRTGQHSPRTPEPPVSGDHFGENLLFGLFNFSSILGSSGTSSSSSQSGQDLASTSQNLFYSYFCIKSLYALAEFAAPVLDVVYASEEKDKMIPLITNLMSYVIPYLKSHSPHNLPCFDACSRLLASLSGYQYTRKAWRRESLDLLLDPAFFQMLPECLPAWRTIIDHLMTHDKNTFREFLQRMSVAQSPSVSFKIFVPSSITKDQDSEPRAQLVKRLAFILFCSEKDQYQKYMAEIQEKLIEIHRTASQQQQQHNNNLSSSSTSSSSAWSSTSTSAPGGSNSSQMYNQILLQSQVLLAFRVIILRMSPNYLASLWPFIYTEMFQVFLTIELQLLKTIREERKALTANEQSFNCADSHYLSSTHQHSHRLSTGSTGSYPGMTHPRSTRLEPRISPAQLQLFLNACKLLDLALLLPSDTLPQFQLHKWAFISDPVSNIQSFDWFNLLFGGEQLTLSRHHSQPDTSNELTTPVPSDSLSEQQCSSLDLASMANENYLKSSHFEMNSLIDSLQLSVNANNNQPHSLPAILNQQQHPSSPSSYSNRSLFQNSFKQQQQQQQQGNECSSTNPTTTFVPHIVFINHLLNYLTVCNEWIKFWFYFLVYPTQDSIPTQMQSSSAGTTMSPLLTISSINSIHDLHPFFSSLLYRLNQGTTLATSKAHSSHSFDRQHHQIETNTTATTPTMSTNNPFRRSLDYRYQHTMNNRRRSLNSTGTTTTCVSTPTTTTSGKASSIKSTNNQKRPSKSGLIPPPMLLGAETGGCSLDELFINIDRIIANDFLEPLPQQQHSQFND